MQLLTIYSEIHTVSYLDNIAGVDTELQDYHPWNWHEGENNSLLNFQQAKIHYLGKCRSFRTYLVGGYSIYPAI